MDDSWFDRWTKARAGGITRRVMLVGIPSAIAAIGGRRTTGAVGQKVTICHRTGRQADPYTIISVSSNALRAHLAHGDFEAFDCGGTWSCSGSLPLFCNSAEICPTGAVEFCPGEPLDPSSSDQAKAACEACFGVGSCVHNDLDCSGAGWLEDFSPLSEPLPGAPVFGYEIGLCNPDNPQPPGRVYFGTASDPVSDYGFWGTAVCP
jgi:hypothetical protein